MERGLCTVRSAARRTAGLAPARGRGRGRGRTVGLGLLGVGAGLELEALRLAEVEEGLARVEHLVRDRGLGGAARLRDIREIWGEIGER